MDYIFIIISAIFVNNIVLSQFLGICPFLGVSSKLNTAVGMSGAVCFVITLATIVTFLLNKILVLCNIQFLQTIVFILVIAALVQMVEIVLKKISPSLYQALGIFLPLITTNCAVLGVALTNVQDELNFIQSVTAGFGTAVGFTIAIVLLAGIRSRIDEEAIPKPFRGAPVVLLR